LKRVAELHGRLGIASIDQLEEACRANRLSALPGFGTKTQQKILEGIEFLRTHSGQFLLPVALKVAETLAAAIRELPGISAVEVAGSIRRRLEVVHNINLVVSAAKPEKALAAIDGKNLLTAFEETGKSSGRGRARNEITVEVHICEPKTFGALLAVQTGRRFFVEGLRSFAVDRGLELTENALLDGGNPLPTPSEEQLFKHLKIPFIPPELREEASALRLKRTPHLISPEDLRGTFHAHSTWSDGKATLDEMLEAARNRGWEYIGMSDHSKTASYAGGLTEERVEQQRAEIEKVREIFAPMRIFRGTEADILADGRIDYHDTILGDFDFVIASVHSRFKMERDEMTERIVKALGDPRVTFLGHLTGRLLLSRPGYSLHFDRIFDAAAKHGVIIEINGSPRRLDLDWRHMQRALDRGVVFSIHPDAHSTENLGHVVTGTWAARKGGLGPEHVFNTLGVEEVGEYLAKRRAAAKKALSLR
jgi:DNA polymerase (family 10)